MTQKIPKVEFLTTRPKLEAGREQTVDVLIRITPPALELTHASRPRLNLSLVLDRSGSMGGQKIVRAREAANFCVDQLLPEDHLGVVTFDDYINVLFPNQPVANKESMKDLISRVEVGGSTALHEAWVRGGLMVSEKLLEPGINRVMLITDGQANVGLTNTDEIVTQTMGLFQRGVSTSTIGIGEDFNEDLLMPMAQSGGGNAWHVEKPDDLQQIFQVELEGLVSQVAHTVSLGMIPADGARIVDLLNDFELTETGRYRLPNLQAGSPLDVVVQIRLNAQPENSRMRLLDLRLGLTPQGEGKAEVLKLVHEIEFVSHAEFESLPINDEVIKVVQFLMNARARREAMRRLDAQDFVGAQHVLSQARVSTAALCAGRPGVSAECASLAQAEQSLTDRLKDKLSRKRLAYEAYKRSTGK